MAYDPRCTCGQPHAVGPHHTSCPAHPVTKGDPNWRAPENHPARLFASEIAPASIGNTVKRFATIAERDAWVDAAGSLKRVPYYNDVTLPVEAALS